MEVEEEDHYTILGLPSGDEGANLGIKEIEKAYKFKLRTFHLENNPNPNDPLTKSTLQKLQSAYNILKNISSRKAFDDLIRAKLDRHRRENLFESKRRKMMSDLEKRERAAYRAREEEEMAVKKFREEIERIRDLDGEKMGELGQDLMEENVGNCGGLDKERVLKVSWERDGEDYSPERLKDLFGRFGHVEDVVNRRGSKKRKNSLLIMASKSAAAAALYSPPAAMVSQSPEVFEINRMLPPPMRRFQSREELLEHVRNFAKAQGYMITIKRSEKEKRVILGCDRGGTYRSRSSSNHRQRKICSRLINCPFKVEGTRKIDGSWILKVKNGEHNHEALEGISGHPFSRRFSKEEVLQIKEMIAAGIQPRQMVTTLRNTNPNLAVVSSDVYNIKKKIRLENLSGRTPIQALLDELARGGFQYNLKYDGEGRLTHLFFAHPNSIAMSKSYSNVFVMDCTCKTNKYKMTLLDVVGVTSFNTSFYSCFALLGKEEEEDYMWALEMLDAMLGSDSRPAVIMSNRELSLMRAIHVVFSGSVNLLCIWHIEKSIWSNCKPHFKVGGNWDGFLSSWSALINSSTEVAYYEAWQGFQAEFREKVGALNYIATALLPFKELFVKAWTENHLHFGNRVTSNVQGAHSKLKKYVRLSTSDLNLVKNKICLAIENQLQKIQTQLSAEKTQVPHKFCIPFFDELVGHVSFFALRQLFKQYRLATCNPTLSICMNQFTRTMGLPCAHKMRCRMGENDVLHLTDIHSQWRIDIRMFNNIDAGANSVQEDQMREMEMPVFHNLDVQYPSGRSPRSKNLKTTSTPQDPSAFENAEKIRKCGLCKGIGHNSRTCLQKTVATVSMSHFSSFISIDDGSAMDMQNLNDSF
ncbi:PKS-NRPS hybrid synthetase cheA-like isoform X2 [Tasmannia lanceolata]|uniref:PKS-NRPS hybrid synthetase cheA-like isoform X2 n=1 Tax=Tasmannia lanceolata TaxID=3420 RepID=UPI004062DFCE